MNNATPIPSGKSRRGFFTCGKYNGLENEEIVKLTEAYINFNFDIHAFYTVLSKKVPCLASLLKRYQGLLFSFTLVV